MGALQAIKSIFIEGVPPAPIEQRGALTFYGVPSLNNPKNSLSDIIDFETGTHPANEVSPLSAMRLAAVFACVNIRSQDASTIDYHIEEQVEPGRWERNYTHYLNDFMQDPSGQYSWQTILQALFANADLCGNGVAPIVRSRQTGMVTDIDIRAFHEVSIHFSSLDRKTVWYHTTDQVGGTMTLREDEVIHHKNLSLDGIIGVNPIGAASQSIAMNLGAQSYATFNYNNGGFGGGIISTDEYMDPPSRLKFAKQVRQARAMGLDPVFDQGMTYTPNTLSPKDIDYINSMRFGRSDIASIYRVPMSKIEGESKTAGANKEQEAIQYTTDCIRPIVQKMETELERKLLSPSERKRFRIKGDLSTLMRGDMKTEAEYYSKMLVNRVFVPNEVRQMKGLAPTEWGDKPIDNQKSAQGTPGGPNIHTTTKTEEDAE